MASDVVPGQVCTASGVVRSLLRFSELGLAWTEAIVPLQQAYAESWSPGKFEWVDSGHDIHVEKPEVVADAVRWVLQNRSG